MGTFGRLVFCKVKTQIVGKTKFFDSLRLPVRESLLLLSFWNISERKLDALLDLDFAVRNLCAILREYRRLHAPRDAAACRQLPRHGNQSAGDAAVPAERLHLHRRSRRVKGKNPIVPFLPHHFHLFNIPEQHHASKVMVKQPFSSTSVCPSFP